MLGIQIGATLVPTVGVGYSINFDLLTRGRDAGFHMSQTLSLRAGEEAGVSISGVDGHYNGDANYAISKADGTVQSAKSVPKPNPMLADKGYSKWELVLNVKPQNSAVAPYQANLTISLTSKEKADKIA